LAARCPGTGSEVRAEAPRVRRPDGDGYSLDEAKEDHTRMRLALLEHQLAAIRLDPLVL
jgi:hypothetical protein